MNASSWPRQRAGILSRIYAPEYRSGLYQENLRLLEAADQLGLHSGWLAQHHFGAESARLPSPLLLLAHAAQRTKNLRLGTAVIVLPLEPVLRLAEDAATLDLLSNGRFELGFGTGFDGPSFLGFGKDAEERAQIYDERIEQITSLIDDGAPDPIRPKVKLQPHAPGLRQRLWESRSDAALVAERGNGLIVAPRAIGSVTSQQLVANYRKAWRGGRVVHVRGIFPGRDRATVLAEIGGDITRYAAHRFPNIAPSALLEKLGVLYGSPADIADQLATSGDLKGVDLLLAQLETFSSTPAQIETRLRLFTEELLPQLPVEALP